MKYEVRMTITFQFRDGQGYINAIQRSTIIDYLDAENVAEAYIKAARNKLSIAIDVTKEMKNTSRWGGTINKVSISLDAVVAKPELESNKLGEYIETLIATKIKMDKLTEKYEKFEDEFKAEKNAEKKIIGRRERKK